MPRDPGNGGSDIIVNREPMNTSLADRHRAEALFHDHKYETGESFPRHYKINPTAPVLDRMLAMLGSDLSNRRVLDYGCGNGWTTTQLAGRGATVSAFDISPEAVAQARAAAAREGLADRCDVRVMAGESLEYADNSFDIAVGFAILHHLELNSALSELHRVLKPGGRAYFAEPLASNPLIRLYRRLTPQFRTVDEEPIDIDRLAARLGRFSKFEHHEHMLLAAGALACCYVPGLTGAAPAAQRFLMKVDDAVLRVLPAMGKWAWYSVLVFQK
jgi:SAM-dependent methyltransferase